MATNIEWTKDALMALIQAYKEQTLLYDTKMTPLYYNKKARQAAMDKVLEEVQKYRPGSTQHDIVKKLQVLRTQYGQELTKIRKSQGYGDEYTYAPRIWWFPELNFLRDYMKSRPTVKIEVKEEEQSFKEMDEEEVKEPSNKRIILSKDDNITIVDRSGNPISEQSSKNSNQYVIYENESYLENPDQDESEIIVEPYTKPSSSEPSRHEQIGKFVASQMSTIKDDILFYQTQHEILTIINKANLKQLEMNMKGGRASSVISLQLESE
ncbi:uncharacterized protein LOC134838199 [Culicoides brevitarsis]|uniref:uncharacterized protein LOC134838199 n=1 Tax=Culicoides brevitarsis TaxID=469753 RepID=UPI00307C978F